MGFSANPLTLGCDCLGEIHYFDGDGQRLRGQCGDDPQRDLHARGGFRHLLEAHRFPDRGGRGAPRRAGWSISMICTVGNYEYGFFWYFYNDASMEVEVKLSGVLTTGAVPDGEEPRWGKMVAPNIYGPNHQHFFNFRLDMSVDGAGNSVYEVDSIPEPDPALQPAPQCVDHPGHAGRVGGRRRTRLELVDRPVLEGHQPVEDATNSAAPVAYKLMPTRDRAGHGAGGVLHLRPRAVRPAQPVGDEVRRRPRSSRRATTCTSHADAQGLPRVHRRRRAVGEHRRRALVHRSARTTWCGRRTGR